MPGARRDVRARRLDRQGDQIAEQLCGCEISSSDVSRATAKLDQEFEKWLAVPAGLVVGLLSGTYTYLLQRWIGDGAIRTPIGEYGWVISFNLLVWVWWFFLIAGVLWLGRNLRITRENAWRSVPAHLALGILFGLVNGTSVGIMRHGVFWLSGFLAMPEGAQWTLLGGVQRELLTTFENQVLIYGGVIATSHVIEFNRTLQDQNSSTRGSRRGWSRHSSNRCSDNSSPTSCSTRSMPSRRSSTGIPTPPKR